MQKSFWWWVKYIILFIWQLPQNLVAVIVMPFIGKLTKVWDGDYSACYHGERMSGGISLGSFAFISNCLNTSSRRKEYIYHELFGHTVDSKRWGPLYLIVWGLPSLLNAAFGFTSCYYDFYAEKSANKHAGLEHDDNCLLKFKQQ